MSTPTRDDIPSWPPTDEDRAGALDDLREILAEIEPFDQDYEPRYVLVLMALAGAALAGVPAGFAVDPAQPERPVIAYIELPTGQVSWHMRNHPTPWDGHTTDEKYERIRAYLAGPADAVEPAGGT